MMSEQVKHDPFNPPHHKLRLEIQTKLDTLLKEYESQFAKDDRSIRTTPLTEITINTGNSNPHVTKAVSNSNDKLSMGERRN